jgi:hypothetical protein
MTLSNRIIAAVGAAMSAMSGALLALNTTFPGQVPDEVLIVAGVLSATFGAFATAFLNSETSKG